MPSLRVHIVPADFNRPGGVITPLHQQKADKAYLVLKSKDEETSYGFELMQRILTRGWDIEVNTTHVKGEDVCSCLEKYREIFDSEQGNHIFVNVSTGNKIMAIAGMLACMLWKGTPYYVRLDDGTSKDSYKRHLDELPQDYSPILGIDYLPVYGIAKPSLDSMKVLSVINEAGGHISKKNLIEKLQSPGYRMIPKYPASATKSAPHSRLHAILNPLEKHWRFVTVQARGRRSQVTLTEEGKGALRIFGGGKVYR